VARARLTARRSHAFVTQVHLALRVGAVRVAVHVVVDPVVAIDLVAHVTVFLVDPVEGHAGALSVPASGRDQA
jgi:hypothetical protein